MRFLALVAVAMFARACGMRMTMSSAAEQRQIPQRTVRGVKRIRQHINPLGARAQVPVELPENWLAAAFAAPDAPLTVDLGCALGGWVIESAGREPHRNFLGLEIRKGAFDAARAKLERLNLPNAHFINCNANVDVERVLGDAAKRGIPLERVLVQFPDPHFKKKHHKRRVVTPELVRAIAAALANSTAEAPFAYLASDVIEAAEHMRDGFREHAPPCLVECAETLDDEGWRLESPLSVATERERCVLASMGATSTLPGKVFRSVFVRPPADRT